ncbi:hypothetical protein ABBQ32_010443 [Trebouxia sp. C0010 RCD-2024]
MFRLVYSGEGAAQPLVDESPHSPKNRSGSFFSTETGETWPPRAKPSGSSISESGSITASTVDAMDPQCWPKHLYGVTFKTRFISHSSITMQSLLAL